MVSTSRNLDKIIYQLEDIRFEWSRIRMILELDSAYTSENQRKIVSWITTTNQWFFSNDIQRLQIFLPLENTILGVEESLTRLSTITDGNDFSSPNELIVSIDTGIISIRTSISNYRQSLDSGYSTMIQAQILLIMMLLILMIVSLEDRRGRRLTMENDLRIQSEIAIAQENERNRIAFDLHDGIAQEVSWLRMNMEKSEGVENQITVLDGLQIKIRGLSQSLRLPDFSVESFDSVVRDLLADFEKHTALNPLYISSNISPKGSPLIYGHLYRIIQECLSNSRKHAGECRVFIELQEEGNILYFEYKDDGRGFDIDSPEAANSMGFKSMKYRVRILKGTISIDSQLKHGTKIRCEFPLGE